MRNAEYTLPMPAKKRKSASAKKQKNAPEVHRWMNVMEIVALHPDAGDVLAAYGLHCIGCAYNTLDTLEEGAYAHGLTDDDIQSMLDDLGELIATVPKHQKSLSVTRAAAMALFGIAKQEGKEGCFLRVMNEGASGFCMEFVDTKDDGDFAVSNADVPELTFVASQETLQHIGGATIDFRDGRFKLDVQTRCCKEDSCSCRDETKK